MALGALRLSTPIGNLRMGAASVISLCGLWVRLVLLPSVWVFTIFGVCSMPAPFACSLVPRKGLIPALLLFRPCVRIFPSVPCLFLSRSPFFVGGWWGGALARGGQQTAWRRCQVRVL